LILVAVAAALLAGCSNGTPGAASLKRQNNANLPVAPVAPAGPSVSLISPNGPSVSLKPGVAAQAPAQAAISQQAAAQLAALDESIEAMELLSPNGAGFKVQGFFGDLVDSIKRVWTRWKLTATVKAALKHNDDKAFELHEGELDTMKKNRTAPVTKITDLEDGSKEITATWTSTYKGEFKVEADRIIDTDGITQVLALEITGTNDKKEGVELTRTRKLVGEDGAYEVTTDETRTFKDERKQKMHWVKTVKADGTETISGYIDHVDGWRTQITGTRDADKKVKVEVSKIAPAHNPANE
jgi:hypothetical protein